MMGLGDTGRRVPALQTWTWQNVAFAFVLRPSHGLRQWLPRSYAASCGLLHFHPCVSAPTSLSAQPFIATPPPAHHSLGGYLRGCSLSTPYCLRAIDSPSKRREGVKSFGFIVSSSKACLPLRSGWFACPSKVSSSVADTVFHCLLQYL